VEVSDGGVLIAKFRYDGEGRRILEMFDSQSPAGPDGLDTYEHLFLSGQQVVETRQGTLAQPTDDPAEAERLPPKYQNIWSPRYIDSLILRDANILYRWKARILSESGPVATAMEARVQELEMELRRVEQERDILKKALAIFSRKT